MLRAVCILVLACVSLAAETPGPCDGGMALYRRGDLVNAQNSLWACLESGLGGGTHAVYLAQTYRELKNYESGLTRSNAARRDRPDSVDLLYLAAYLHYRRNETKESMILVSKAYRLAPNDWRIHQLFALNYISFDMLEAAKLSLLKAIELNPTNAELRYQLARLYFTVGSYVDSIEASKQALAIFPDYPEAHHNLALAYEGSGNTALAVRSFEKAIDLNRKYRRRDEWPLIDFAVYQRMLGSPAASLPLLQEALAINPKSAKANYEMGELLRDLKRYREAKQHLELAVSLDPCNARAFYALAMVARRLGDSENAARVLQRFKEVDAQSNNSVGTQGPCEASAARPE